MFCFCKEVFWFYLVNASLVLGFLLSLQVRDVFANPKNSELVFDAI
jgi:hypothetical protein